MNSYISEQIKCSIDIKTKLFEDDKLIKQIEVISKKIVDTYKNGNKILLAGNGGSAADAQHIAGELVSKLFIDRPGLSAIALSTDTSILTAIGNDYGYEKIFARQIQANGVAGDIFIGISTSGNSQNVILALKECKKMNIKTVSLTGEDGSYMEEISDYCIKVPSKITPRIQESHILVGHIICSVVEKSIFEGGV